jgi:hypothetical protein
MDVRHVLRYCALLTQDERNKLWIVTSPAGVTF